MRRLLSIPFFVVFLIFAGLTQCVISALLDNYNHPIMPFGWSMVGVGFCFAAISIAGLALFASVCFLFNISV